MERRIEFGYHIVDVIEATIRVLIGTGLDGDDSITGNAVVRLLRKCRQM